MLSSCSHPLRFNAFKFHFSTFYFHLYFVAGEPQDSGKFTRRSHRNRSTLFLLLQLESFISYIASIPKVYLHFVRLMKNMLELNTLEKFWVFELVNCARLWWMKDSKLWLGEHQIHRKWSWKNFFRLAALWVSNFSWEFKFIFDYGNVSEVSVVFLHFNSKILQGKITKKKRSKKDGKCLRKTKYKKMKQKYFEFNPSGISSLSME